MPDVDGICDDEGEINPEVEGVAVVHGNGDDTCGVDAREDGVWD